MLTLDPIVSVNVTVASATSYNYTFDVGLILAPANDVMTGLTTETRSVVCNSLADVTNNAGYAASTDTYKAAAMYFGAEPAPNRLVIGVIKTGEEVEDAINAIRATNNNWYGVYMVGVSAEQIKKIDRLLYNYNWGMQFATVTGAISGLAAAEPLLSLKTYQTRRTVLLYTAAALEAAAVMGLSMGCARQYAGQTWQIVYKSIAGLTPNTTITESEVETLNDLNVNVYVTRAYNYNMLERGETIMGTRVDEMITIDRIRSDIQLTLLSLIAGNTMKLPQNDTTNARFVSAITQVLDAYKSIGYIDPGRWQGGEIGNIDNDDILENGYAIWVDSFSNQTAEDRKARKGMPITVAIRLCGSVESVVLNVRVQE